MSVVCRGTRMHRRNGRDLYRPDTDAGLSSEAGAHANGPLAVPLSAAIQLLSLTNQEELLTALPSVTHKGDMRDA